MECPTCHGMGSNEFSYGLCATCRGTGAAPAADTDACQHTAIDALGNDEATSVRLRCADCGLPMTRGVRNGEYVYSPADLSDLDPDTIAQVRQESANYAKAAREARDAHERASRFRRNLEALIGERADPATVEDYDRD